MHVIGSLKVVEFLAESEYKIHGAIDHACTFTATFPSMETVAFASCLMDLICVMKNHL